MSTIRIALTSFDIRVVLDDLKLMI